MKKILFLFAFAAFLFACKTEKNTETEDTSVEELQKQVEADNTADLANYQYVCDHCKVGSNKAGKCACGMDMKENPDFVAAHSHDGEDADHDHTEEKKEM